MSKDARNKVREFLTNRLAAKGDTKAFDDKESLFTSGRLDSLDAVETVVVLEKEYGVDFNQSGMGAAPFDSVNTIIELLEYNEKKKD